MHLTQLNWECLLHIFSFLDKDSRKRLGQTCGRLLKVFRDPSLWPLLRFHSPSELKRGNFILGTALRCLSVCWHSSQVKVCNIEGWMKSSLQRTICSSHQDTVNDFLLQVCNRCPNLRHLELSGCGHVTDECITVLLKSCSCLQTLQIENCVQISDKTLEAVAMHGGTLQTLHVDFCRNISRAGLQRLRQRRPALTMKAERSASMVPDKMPSSTWVPEKALKKLLWH